MPDLTPVPIADGDYKLGWSRNQLRVRDGKAFLVPACSVSQPVLPFPATPWDLPLPSATLIKGILSTIIVITVLVLAYRVYIRPHGPRPSPLPPRPPWIPPMPPTPPTPTPDPMGRVKKVAFEEKPKPKVAEAKSKVATSPVVPTVYPGAQPYYYAPQPYYYAPQPYYYAPQPYYYYTPGAYCAGGGCR